MSGSLGVGAAAPVAAGRVGNIVAGKGCRVVDVDGNEYIDYVLASGAIILGHADDEVNAAAFEQARHGQLLPRNHPLHMQVTARLLEWFPSAERGLCLESPADATRVAMRIARRATGRRRIVRSSHRGWEGRSEETLEFDATDPRTLELVLAIHGSDVAAVVVAPETVIAGRREPLARIAELTRAAGAVFVLDELTTAFRIRPGSIQRLFDLRPDLTTVSRALGNGWPIAAVLGTGDVMKYAVDLDCPAVFHGDVVAMAAAMQTMHAIRERDVLEQLWVRGEELIAGLQDAADRHVLPLYAYGEPLPPIPMLRVSAMSPDLREAITVTFFGELLARGVLMHPRHPAFLCHAHTAADIRRTIAIADESMSKTVSVLLS